MLKHLYIKNFTLIDTLDIDFKTGFSVITGETGAGKSIVLGAIGLLLGQRADSKSIKAGAEKCIIEASFDLSRYQMESFFERNDIEYDATECIIRRELTSAGKSRSFINDTPVALNMLKELGEQLVDVHSQHQNLLLGKQDFQMNVVDIMAHDTDTFNDYRETYAQYQNALHKLQQLKDSIERNRQQTDFLQFQYDELTAAHLCEGEQEELEQRSETMQHAEEIKSALFETDHALQNEGSGIVVQLKSAISALRSIERVLPNATELAERMDSSYIELKDIAQEISGLTEDIDFDPSELEVINTRLDKIYDLQKKYHINSVSELLNKQQELQQTLNGIENSEEALSELQQELDASMKACEEKANMLTTQRKKAAKEIEKEMQSRLVPLGMPNVRFNVQITQGQLGANGHDNIAFLFSANTSSPMQPVAQVASGGEIARVMLTLKALISGAVKLPTIIFDEIDTGVSGKIAEQMAQIMQEMGRNERQVISITHLPQIAALGTTHYKVFKEEGKEGTVSRMQLLSDEERIHEIAQMLSGSDVTNAAIANAKQLLGME